MTREELFAADASRNESAYYMDMAAKGEDVVLLPVTMGGFNTLVSLAAGTLPVYDKLLIQASAYVHHIERDINTISISYLTKVLHKAAANDMTWQVLEDIKAASSDKKLSIVPNEQT